MQEPQTGNQPRRVVWDMLGIYVLIFVWDLLTTPISTHSDNWQCAWVSIVVLPVSAFWLAKPPARLSRFVLFGAAGSLLFVNRFISMDRFGRWLEREAHPHPSS